MWAVKRGWAFPDFLFVANVFLGTEMLDPSLDLVLSGQLLSRIWDGHPPL